MNENCKKWHEQIQTLRDKHAEFRQAYADALKFAAQNPKIRETSFTSCRVLFSEIKPLIIELKNEFRPSVKYEQIVNRFTLSRKAYRKRLRENLLEMVSEENYNEAVATAKELDPNITVPTREKIIRNLIAMGPEKLEKIGTIMSKPGLIIVPDKSIFQITEAMDDNRHYDNQAEVDYKDYWPWSGNPGKVSVSIVDMVQYAEVVPGQKPGEQRNDEQHGTCKKYFHDNGMSLVIDSQYAVAMQKSLRAYERAKKKGEPHPENCIIDFYGEESKTITMFDSMDVVSIEYGDFNAKNPRIVFNTIGNSAVSDRLRGRGVMQIM